jgi:hypothetical protein
MAVVRVCRFGEKNQQHLTTTPTPSQLNEGHDTSRNCLIWCWCRGQVLLTYQVNDTKQSENTT